MLRKFFAWHMNIEKKGNLIMEKKSNFADVSNSLSEILIQSIYKKSYRNFFIKVTVIMFKVIKNFIVNFNFINSQKLRKMIRNF